jgi:hypothetical protein
VRKCKSPAHSPTTRASLEVAIPGNHPALRKGSFMPANPAAALGSIMVRKTMRRVNCTDIALARRQAALPDDEGGDLVDAFVLFEV